MTLEERYTQAMSLRGYEIADTPEDSMATVTFKRGLEEVGYDGWEAVGISLEETPPGENPELTRKINELIHPQERLDYYVKFMEDIYRTKSFDEAFQHYREIGEKDGATLGLAVDGGRNVDLVWYSGVGNSHILSRVCDPLSIYVPDAAQNELDELKKNCKEMMDVLSRENACIQVSDALSELEYKAYQATEKGSIAGNWYGRVANNIRPQDYIELNITRLEKTQEFKITARSIHANEVKNEIQILADDLNDISGKSAAAFKEKLNEEVRNLDTEYQMPMGNAAFTFYSEHTYNRLEEHYDKLERAGYDRNPSDDAWLRENDSVRMIENLDEARIRRDILQSGFKPNTELIKNIVKFENLEGRRYTLKDFAELKHKNPDFKNSPERAECYEKIISECQNQEMGKTAKSSFMRQEVLAERAMAVLI